KGGKSVRNWWYCILMQPTKPPYPGNFVPFFLLLLGLQFCPAQQYSFHTIPPELLENADAVLRLDELEVELLSTDRMAYRVKKVVTVLNSKGDDFADIRLHYDKDKKIKIWRLSCTAPGGS